MIESRTRSGPSAPGRHISIVRASRMKPPAVFAITRDTFIVYAANAFSLLGLAALYFVLAGMVDRFRFLQPGLAIVLVFVGLKMTLSDLYSIPVYLSLLVIVGVLAASVVASLLRPERPARREPARRPAHTEGGI